jgi:predicted branched-subunit amino acid permease
MKMKDSPFRKGVLTGFGFPGIGMSAAMFGYGVYAGEAGLDIYICLASLLVLWSMPGMVIFVSLYTIGAPIILLFTTVLLANVRQFFLVLSGMTLINIHSHKISFISKLLWAHLISPTGWTELSKARNELEEKELLHFFKGLTLALVTITSLTTIIGYKLYYLLPSDIVSIPVFIMPLYLTILMLRAVEIYYRVAVISGGVICPILFPYFSDWSLIIAGLCGGTLGLAVNHFLNKSKANA